MGSKGRKQRVGVKPSGREAVRALVNYLPESEERSNNLGTTLKKRPCGAVLPLLCPAFRGHTVLCRTQVRQGKAAALLEFCLGHYKVFHCLSSNSVCKEKKLTQISVSETMYPNTFPCLKLRCRKITPCTETVCLSGNGSTVWEPRLLGKGAQVDPGLVGTQVPRCCGCSTAFKKAAPYSSVRVTRRRLLRRGDGVRKEPFQQGMG